MPPKGDKKKAPKAPKEAAEEVNDVEQQEWRALKVEADRLFKTTQKEEQDFNEFQQQREKLNYFWIVEKKKLEDKKGGLRNKERELQDLEEKHSMEIKMYKQRLKHLLHEHQNEVTRKKIEAESALKIAQDDDRLAEADVRGDKRITASSVRSLDVSHEEYLRALRREQDHTLTLLRYEFERRATEIQRSFEARTKKTRERMERRRKEEIKLIEDKKNVKIETLIGDHQRAFADIKNYYNDITHNNLDLIKSLKEEVKELEGEERKDELRLADKVAENKKLSAPLKRLQSEKIRLESERQEYAVEKQELLRVKASLAVAEDEYRGLKWEHEVLTQRHLSLQGEVADLNGRFVTSVFDVKQKAQFAQLLIEKRIHSLTHVQEEREAQLNEVLSRANLDPTVIQQVRGKVGDVLERKTQEGRHATAVVQRLQAKQRGLLSKCEELMVQYGIPPEELGFRPTVG